MRNRQCNPMAPRRGLTLVELLVVLGILMILMGIAATAVKTGTRGKKQREAARQVNAFVAGAQARAMELGRPVGIEIIRHGGLSSGNSSLMMYMIESPPPYAGDTTTAVATLTAPSGGVFTATFDATTASMLTVTDFIKAGDRVRFNYRGTNFRITAIDITTNPSYPALTLTWDTGQSPPRHSAGTYPFQIYPQPIRSSVTPLQLPSDMTIDLAFSGTGNSNNIFHNSYGISTPNFNSAPIRFTFSPRGNVDRLYYNSGFSSHPDGNIHLLIGKYEYAVNADALNTTLGSGDFQILADPAADEENFTNLADATAMWVSINYLTGQITTTRNRLVPFPMSFSTTDTAEQNAIVLAETRKFAKQVLTVQGQGDN